MTPFAGFGGEGAPRGRIRRFRRAELGEGPWAAALGHQLGAGGQRATLEVGEAKRTSGDGLWRCALRRQRSSPPLIWAATGDLGEAALGIGKHGGEGRRG